MQLIYGYLLFSNHFIILFKIFLFSLDYLLDWMQGTHYYQLYQSYEASEQHDPARLRLFLFFMQVDVASLFLTGFLCSAVFGMVSGFAFSRLCFVQRNQQTRAYVNCVQDTWWIDSVAEAAAFCTVRWRLSSTYWSTVLAYRFLC